MTNKELDYARADEAFRLSRGPGGSGLLNEMMACAARLAREGWMPVDPDLVEARALLISSSPITRGQEDVHALWAAGIRKGELDWVSEIQIAIKALKRGRELAGVKS